MSRRTWQRPVGSGGRDATRAQIVEAIDRAAPETKEELAHSVGISEQYLSELLQELKAEDVVRKGYVVDDAALYSSSKQISKLYDDESALPEIAADGETSGRGTQVLELLDRVNNLGHGGPRLLLVPSAVR